MLLEQQKAPQPTPAPATQPETETPQAANDPGRTPGAVEKMVAAAPTLQVGGVDERGNRVKYIYAIDPDYVVYYSRLEQPGTVSADGTQQRNGRWHLPSRVWRSRGKSADGPTCEREGVQAQLSSNPEKRQEQRRKLLSLGTDRAKLQALLSGWPRRESYDSSIATTLQLALDADGDSESLKNARDTLTDARNSIMSERELAGRAQYVLCALVFGFFGFFLLGVAQHNLLHHTDNFWLGTQAGLLGALFSISIGIRTRTVALNTNVRGNLSDSVLRLVIGAISGGTLVLLFSTGLVPALKTHVGDMDGVRSIPFAMLLGIIAGFVEQLVPGILEDQGRKLRVYAPERKSLNEVAGLSGCAGVKFRREEALCVERRGLGDEAGGAVCEGPLRGSD